MSLDFLLPATVGFVLATTIFISLDSNYYNSGSSHIIDFFQQSTFDITSITITPLNAFLYNSKSTNLADHGLHLRTNHSIVNMPLLFGPLYFLLLKKVVQLCCVSGIGKMFHGVMNVCDQVILVGIFVLSCAPHQEPRFLLPLVIPLVISYGDIILRSRLSIFVWVVFNVLLVIFFGTMHQSGLIPSLLLRGNNIGSKINNEGVLNHQHHNIFLFYHTYMPPTFLLRRRRAEHEVDEFDKNGVSSCLLTDACRGSSLRDLKGSPIEKLYQTIDDAITCSTENKEVVADDENDNNHKRHQNVYVVAPPSTIPTPTDDKYHFLRVWSYYPHVTTEDFPAWNGKLNEFFSLMELVVYEVECLN